MPRIDDEIVGKMAKPVLYLKEKTYQKHSEYTCNDVVIITIY